MERSSRSIRIFFDKNRIFEKKKKKLTRVETWTVEVEHESFSAIDSANSACLKKTGCVKKKKK